MVPNLLKTTAAALQCAFGALLLMAKFGHIELANIDFARPNSHVLPFPAFSLFSYFQCM